MKHTISCFFGLSFQALALVACGSSSSNKATENDAGGDGGTTASEASTPTPTGPPAWADAGAPITGTSDMTWTWVPVADAKCRDGSATGFWVNPNSSSGKLMIFLEGGGACFNSFTCATNPASAPGGSTYAGSSAGILNRGDMANPVRDWNFVDFPYCSGDVFAGNAPNTSVSGVAGMQQFVGYLNVAAFLKRIVPTFPHVTQVLLTGVSAGGFGSSANYGQVAKAFDPVPVTLLDDSGPQMRDPYLAKCLLQEQAMIWGFDKTILLECGSDCPDMGSFPIDASRHTAKLYPKVPLALVEATDDSVITGFFGFGQSNCTGSFGTPVSKQQFTDGLNDARSQLSALPNIGSFIFDGTRHTSISGQFFDTQTATGSDGGMVVLSDWITDIVVNGKISNVGPP